MTPAFGLALAVAMQAGSPAVRLDDKKAPMAEKLKAAKELGKAKKRDKKAVDALLRGLQGPGEELRGAVKDSLRALEAAAVLIPRAFDENEMLNDRRLAIEGLRTLNDPSSYDALKRLLESEHESLRREAAFALTVGGADQAEPALIKALGDTSKDVRYFAAVALGGSKTPEAVKAIEARAKVEPEFTVKDALEQAAIRQKR